MHTEDRTHLFVLQVADFLLCLQNVFFAPWCFQRERKLQLRMRCAKKPLYKGSFSIGVSKLLNLKNNAARDWGPLSTLDVAYKYSAQLCTTF